VPVLEQEQVQVQELERVPERELSAEMALPAVALMPSNIPMPVHTGGLTRAGSARECFRFKGAIRARLSKTVLRLGLATAG